MQGLGGGPKRFRASNRQPDGTYPPLPKKYPPQIPGDVSDLEGMNAEEMVKAGLEEAILTIRSIVRRPGRNAMAQLNASKVLLEYGMQKPSIRQELSGAQGGPIQSEHRLVFVDPVLQAAAAIPALPEPEES